MRKLIVATALLAGCAAPESSVNPGRNFAPPAPSEPAPELTDPRDISRALRAGGYVLWTRHGVTNRHELEVERKHREAGTFLITDCKTQRNLSPEGVAEAKAAGAAFRRLGLPVARFVSSRYCRVAQTAQAFSDKVEWSEALTSDGPTRPPEERLAPIYELLSAKPPAGQNTMLFAHQGIFFYTTRLTVQEGWTVVLVPGDTTRVIARIAPGDWEKLPAR